MRVEEKDTENHPFREALSFHLSQMCYHRVISSSMFLPNIELLAGVVSSSLNTWEQAGPLGTEEQEERRLRGETATALDDWE